MKGVRYLREAAIALLGADSNLRLICAGTLAPSETVLAQFPPALRDRITVLSRVNQQELVQVYRDADVFVFPSLYEGFSRAIVEAMAAKLPIVSTRVGVAGDALQHEQNALLIPKRSSGSIVTAVQRLRDDPALSRRLGESAGETARDYTLATISKRTIDVIMKAVSDPQ